MKPNPCRHVDITGLSLPRLLKDRTMPDSTPETRREAVEFANAVCALEGLHPTPEAEALNERIIAGEISIAEAIAQSVAAAKARASAKRSAPPAA